jgi:hypothetical protein
MTAAGTFPKDVTDQQVQANVVAAGYAPAPVSIKPASAMDTPPGVQTFTPGSSQETTVIYTNTTNTPATHVMLSVALPSKEWSVVLDGGSASADEIAGPVAPGASVSATFKVSSGQSPLNGDLVGHASWNSGGAIRLVETMAEKVRNVSPVKINEFRVATNFPANSTDSFIELYNAGSKAVDLSNWTLTQHAAQQAIFSSVRVPEGTKLAAGGFYLLGLSDPGLAIGTRKGDSVVDVRSTKGMSVGDTIGIGSGPGAETRTIASLGTAAGQDTTVWQSLPEGPVITTPVGSTNVPVANTTGFAVGEKTITAVGKPGTQESLATDARAGATTIQVTSVKDISSGDKIRLDIDSVGHGIETVTVAKVGTQAERTMLVADASAGATHIRVRNVSGFAAGDKVILGTPVSQKTYTITAVTDAPGATGIDFSPAFAEAHSDGEDVVRIGTGLKLTEPLHFTHAANLPFSVRGTGITFEPATKFAHSSDEPVQSLGTGITLDRPLANEHGIDAVVYDEKVDTAGYQGKPQPDQWFGGPELSSAAGSMVLRDASGHVADSLNYGLVVDPWAAEGYQGNSPSRRSGCRAPAPDTASGAGTSVGRFPDGADTDSNCQDFLAEPATILAAASPAGAANIKVESVMGFRVGQSIRIDAGAESETETIARVGTAGATTVRVASSVGAAVISVARTAGFGRGDTITVGSGNDEETAVLVSANRYGGTVTVSKPLSYKHEVGDHLSGTGITLAGGLVHPHDKMSSIAGDASTPGSPNRYYRSDQ